jgi:hypothetical protein
VRHHQTIHCSGDFDPGHRSARHPVRIGGIMKTIVLAVLLYALAQYLDWKFNLKEA